MISKYPSVQGLWSRYLENNQYTQTYTRLYTPFETIKVYRFKYILLFTGTWMFGGA